ncbi:MAG: hypothetical protein SGI83_14800 [Bacteroidota bacterium]|nr:hypothetical protein [Bacteroidota bacterium]
MNNAMNLSFQLKTAKNDENGQAPIYARITINGVRDEDVKKCDTCGTQQFRVMGKFRDYLLKYASDNEKTKKEVNDIYNLRSKIAHTGLFLLGDNKIDWSNDAKQNEQGQTHLQVMQISRVSLTIWLLMRGALEKKTN